MGGGDIRYSTRNKHSGTTDEEKEKRHKGIARYQKRQP